MHRVAELLRRRRIRVIFAEVGVVRLVAIRSPIALHLAGIGIEHGNTLVEITIGDIRFVGLRIDPDLGRPPEILEVVAPGILAEVAHLHQEFSVLGELQDLGVLGAVAADPDVALIVDVDAVIGFRPLVSLPRAATVLFTSGTSTVPLSIPVSGPFALQGYGGSTAANSRLAAVEQLLGQASDNVFVTALNGIGNQALALSGTVNPILAGSSAIVDPIFAGLNSDIANQFHQVAKMIAARQATGAARQIFFVQLGSFDTHGDQLNRQQALFADLSPALKAFYDATVAVGAGSQVTTFTLSDFSRTFQPASGGGTDHAWGNHHFIVGDAVKGGSIYGHYPQLILGGPDDAEQQGRWLPTSSVDQYAATLATWFGVAPAALGQVFPNLAAFPASNLGFMS